MTKKNKMKQFSNSCLKHVFGGLLMAIMFFAVPQVGSATHIVGGDISYRCLGNNQYEVVLMIRRDCLNGQAPFDAEASIGIFDENGVLLKQFAEAGEIIIPFDDSSVIAITSDCTTSGEDVCVEETTYIGVVTLPFSPAGYTFGYQRCCFNNTVDNVVDPLDTGFTSHIDLTADAQTECNSSPAFNPVSYTHLTLPTKRIV